MIGKNIFIEQHCINVLKIFTRFKSR